MADLASLLQEAAPMVQFGWLGRLFVFFLLVGVPFLASFQPQDRDLVLPPRRALYLSAIVGVVVLGSLTAAVLALEGRAPAVIGLHGTGVATFVAWTLAVTLGALVGNFVISRLAARIGMRESRLTYHLMPQGPDERALFLLVSASAGLCEEFAYHGFLLAGLNGWLENGWIAALVANLSFGVLHGYQGQAGVVRAATMGYLLSLPVILGAGLWPAIAAHFLVNALLGLGLWRWMVPEGASGAGEREDSSF